jgi:hypothetical protein
MKKLFLMNIGVEASQIIINPPLFMEEKHTALTPFNNPDVQQLIHETNRLTAAAIRYVNDHKRVPFEANDSRMFTAVEYIKSIRTAVDDYYTSLKINSDNNESLTSELSSALESYNRECKRNDELQEEVDRLKQWKKEEIELWWPIIELMRLDTTIPLGTSLSDEALKRLKEFKSQKEEIELYREALSEGVCYLKSGPLKQGERYLLQKIESALSRFQPVNNNEN